MINNIFTNFNYPNMLGNYTYTPALDNYGIPSVFMSPMALPTLGFSLFNGFNLCNFGFGNNIFSTTNTSIKTQNNSNSGINTETTAVNVNGKTLKGKGKDTEYGPEFLAKVKQIAKNINCNYTDLLAVMNSESGINSKARNNNGGATGLIQFMPSTAKHFGTTTAALKNMTPIQQLDYVEKYLEKNKKSAGFDSSHKLSAGELYALIFLPARAKREILTQTGEKYYAANKGVDTNKDGKITKSELDARVKTKAVSDNTFLT